LTRHYPRSVSQITMLGENFNRETFYFAVRKMNKIILNVEIEMYDENAYTTARELSENSCASEKLIIMRWSRLIDESDDR